MRNASDTDYGTPAIQSLDSLKLVQLSINGIAVRVPAGTSVMRAAALSDIQIPRLCATDTLDAFGSCRLCLVEIEGMKGYPASCTTPVADGMRVSTQSDRLAELRRGVMELYVSDHPLDCDTCPANGHCELQDMAEVVGVSATRYGHAGANHFRAPGNDHVVAPDLQSLFRV
jgi:formate dehydrogenase major subunit